MLDVSMGPTMPVNNRDWQGAHTDDPEVARHETAPKRI